MNSKSIQRKMQRIVISYIFQLFVVKHCFLCFLIMKKIMAFVSLRRSWMTMAELFLKNGHIIV